MAPGRARPQYRAPDDFRGKPCYGCAVNEGDWKTTLVFMAMTESAHILVVDDEADIRDELQEYLARKGFRVSTADGGPAMRRILDRKPADLIILYLTMPREHGLTLVGHLRKTSNAGIIILTGTGDAADEIVGLELGADDYISKPFNSRELLARVRSVLRRVGGATDAGSEEDEASLQFVGWNFNLSARRLNSPESSEVPLTTAEFDLLATFVKNANRVLNRDQLLGIMHDRDWSPFDRSVDILVSRLRRKIEADPKKPQLIKTVRGKGYVFTPKLTRD